MKLNSMLSGQALEHMIFDNRLTYEVYQNMSLDDKIKTSIEWLEGIGIDYKSVFLSVKSDTESKTIKALAECSKNY